MAVKTMTLGDASTTVNVNANGNVTGANLKNKGSNNNPVYFDSNGVATPTSYSLDKISEDVESLKNVVITAEFIAALQELFEGVAMWDGSKIQNPAEKIAALSRFVNSE